MRGRWNDGLETRRWNGTKSAFADYAAASSRFDRVTLPPLEPHARQR
jgi:hypothetical protein